MSFLSSGQAKQEVMKMKPFTAGLSDLLSQDQKAREYFQALPPDVRTAVCDQEIATLDALKAQAERILRAPY